MTGPEHRADHDRDAEQRHRRAALLRRVDVEQDALRERHQRGAEQALQQAEQRRSAAATARAPHSTEATTKPAIGDQEHALAAEPAARKPDGGVMIAAATI